MPAPLQTRDLPGVHELLETAVSSVGGSRREGQDRMADAVRRSLSSGEHLAVQAGTGTGKSLAYLVPAIRHAIARDTTVVVSTATIALQRQLVDRDLPRVATSLKKVLGREPTFAILKGRRNYLCLNKLHGDMDDDPLEDQLFDAFAVSALGRNVKRLHDWASDTETGDRDELVPGVPDTAWRQVSVTARECLGASRCPVGEDCFAEKARAEAGRADIVVTNHALLAIDAMGEAQVLPEHDVVIVDEAHELVDRVTGAATAELTAGTVATAARRCGKLVDQELADRLSEAGEGLGAVLEDLPPARWESLPTPASGALNAILTAAAGCRQAMGGQRRADDADPDGAAARKLALAVLDEVSETCVRLVDTFSETDPAKRRDVVWLGEQGPDGSRYKVVRVAPLSVGGLLRERLFNSRTTVLTSATLALGGSFDALARQWGLPASQPKEAGDTPPGEPVGHGPVQDPEAPRWQGLDVGSPFAHGKSGILYLAKRLPAPGRDGLAPQTLDEIEGLVRAAGGRTLGLFSSTRAAKQATEALRGKLDTPLLCQGDDSTMLLVKRFAEDEETSLFGTLSLWQGVDVPGPSLSCVIIDRIPFPRPDDPLVAARQKATDSRGGNGFLSVSATHAALLLAQGAGRLLRSTDDRGVVAILDPRIATARYGGFLRASLPPFWETTDVEKVHGALKRLRGA
ncbi:ATP-dependent helicase [Pseudonocardia sp. EC080610-09]|uniref:ATP-dependent DNA helicase n=1 Tax=unclassified Pseudonocardia TaxID=2619320 RepID=UPI0006CB0276|nr:MULTISPECIES: ATP-dependent DNA helicase [unclassified Pseudonocardia]ALE74719.1 ATP-dependent helicase [Pseudonocardia sp. EC080625-04]ALL78152.1 ATP-dependent helicase [Pseudonocardia sp. EC080610-09]ALL81064.1 ATP-dependent helicase [Pseudonocardia sp. EC080619-01]